MSKLCLSRKRIVLVSETVRKTSRSKRQTLAISLFIIAACLGLGIYAFLGGSGNVLTAQAGKACTGTLERAAKLADLAKGDMAAFMPAERVIDFKELAFKDGTGADKTLADWQGKAIFVNLWATWCGPCRHEMPSINAMSKTFSDEGFDVVALSLDQGSQGKPKAFLQEINADSLNFYQDNTNKVFLELREEDMLTGLPGSYLLDKDGCMLGALLGPAEWMSPDAQNLIKATKEL